MRFVMGLFIALYGAAASSADWRTASHEPVGLAPNPATTHEAVVQVYGARTWGWKGIFGVHTWVAAKPTDAAHWTVYEVNVLGLSFGLGQSGLKLPFVGRIGGGRHNGAPVINATGEKP